jgi:DHA1 family inner membrane transport protein
MNPSPEEESPLHSSSREVVILLILAAVQFTTIVDFMIVMPLGPQLMRKLSINPAQFGVIVSSYTFAAGAAGLVASAIIDRFGRRAIFMFLYAGFLFGTWMCAFAPGYYSLVAARVLTGAFGGILGGISYAIIGDVFPDARRGRATGALMTAFSVASVAGVPLGLYLGTNYGWNVPFIALVIAGLPALVLAPFALPKLDRHVGQQHVHPLRSMAEVFTVPNHLNAFALMISLMIGSFAVVPYIATFFVQNVGMTEEQLPFIYIGGGALTLVTAPLVGVLADRFGKLLVFRFVIPGSALLMVVITHLSTTPAAIAVALFGALMVFNAGRMIPAMAMITGSVAAKQRGAFLSANSSVQHIAAGAGAFLGGLLIKENAAGQMERFGLVGWLAAGATLLSLWLAGRVRLAEPSAISAEAISLAAAAEATMDVGEPLIDCPELTAEVTTKKALSLRAGSVSARS